VVLGLELMALSLLGRCLLLEPCVHLLKLLCVYDICTDLPKVYEEDHEDENVYMFLFNISERVASIIVSVIIAFIKGLIDSVSLNN
jgi:hypothetical protein